MKNAIVRKLFDAVCPKKTKLCIDAETKKTNLFSYVLVFSEKSLQIPYFQRIYLVRSGSP
jgi:hypothetical protein